MPASYLQFLSSDPADIETPASGRVRFFADSTNGDAPSYKDDAGVVHAFVAGAGAAGGDLAGTYPDPTIANDAVTYAKLQNISATDRLLGRSTAGAGNAEEIACTAAGRALIAAVDAAAERTVLGLGTVATLDSDPDGTLAANSDAKIATQKAIRTYVAAAVAALVNASPSTLDTLKELADALGDDPNFATTTATALAGKIANTLLTTLGDTIYASAANTPVRLAGNTTATKKFLRQTGTGSVSAAPAWDTLVEGDLPGPSMTTLTDGATITWTVTGKREDRAQLTIAGARTLAITGASAGFVGVIHITESGASRSLALPAGSIVANSGAGAIALSGTSGGKQKWTVSYDGTNYWWEKGATYT